MAAHPDARNARRVRRAPGRVRGDHRQAAGRQERACSRRIQAADVLTELRACGLQLAVCSNWDWDLAEAVAEVGLSTPTSSSRRRGPGAQAHPLIFEHTLAELRRRPGARSSWATWGPDVVGPRAVGMTPLYLLRVDHWRPPAPTSRSRGALHNDLGRAGARMTTTVSLDAAELVARAAQPRLRAHRERESLRATRRVPRRRRGHVRRRARCPDPLPHADCVARGARRRAGDDRRDLRSSATDPNRPEHR